MPRSKMTRTPKTLPKDFLSLVREFPLLAIHDRPAYDNAMEYVDALTSIGEPTQGQLDYLESLSILVEDYENREWNSGDISALEVLKLLMDEHEMNASDLGRLLGERTLGPKILNGRRELSKSHIRALADHFGVRADLFL